MYIFFYFKGEYNFAYAVEDAYSGNQFGHSENRFGADTVSTIQNHLACTVFPGSLVDFYADPHHMKMDRTFMNVHFQSEL